ncbi:hypothetical protein AWW66_30670 [Micromonospora rosaria]|uniref:Uncharacterized protein n=1 Tax=Micromonospora rosaria TaxID=47874 RepID=A0A136PIQ7_9ACTN|nr:hypothetical protein [Micromonospora rosaria]KXK58279.1 hypothetical protein AWW66_30670 [Micromonospora rosaria]
MPHRSPRWIWAGRLVGAAIVLALVGYLTSVELARANMVAGCVSAIVALAALTAPYLLPARPGAASTGPGTDRAEETGAATATGGGQATTGVRAGGSGRPARAYRTGAATAHGPGSTATSGVTRQR